MFRQEREWYSGGEKEILARERKNKIGNLEPILPNFHFSGFPIFAVKLGHFMVKTFFFISYKHSSLSAENGKILCFRRKKVW